MVPTDELPVLEALVNIRNRLTALKKDRTEYIRAKDVLDIYSALMDQGELPHSQSGTALTEIRAVTHLNDIRTPATPKASTSSFEDQGDSQGTEVESEEPVEENRVDTILNDVFQLLSLFFLTIGKARESPATFCQLATMKRLLTHLNESGIYTFADLKPFQTRLLELKAIITSGQGFDASDDEQAPGEAEDREEGLTKLLLAKWDDCDRLLTKLIGSLSQLSPELGPLHQRLITLRRLLASIAARPRSTSADIVNILTELRQISDRRSASNKFVIGVDAEGNPIVPIKGQALLNGLLEDNFNFCEDIKSREGSEDVARGPLQPIYDRLSELRAQLERLVLTHRWTLRETDLYNYQMALQEIDGMRVDGKFVDSEGNRPEGQLVLLYLLRRCFGLCYRLMASSEPISEELMPIANKLTTVKRCLLEVQKFGGPYSQRDLYPFQLSLAQIDELRTDGRFQGRDGSVPEGQAILNALLSEAHEIISVMREESG